MPHFVHGLSHMKILGLTMVYVTVVRPFTGEFEGVETSLEAWDPAVRPGGLSWSCLVSP